MGERTEFEPGHNVPNDGEYIEVGDRDFHMGIEDPRHVSLQAGDTFPETSKERRKWKLHRKGH